MRFLMVFEPISDIAFHSFILEPVVRFELFDPSDQFNNDQLIYITIGLNWYFTFLKDHEIILRASYTIKLEETPDRTLNNDQFHLLMQYRL